MAQGPDSRGDLGVKGTGFKHGVVINRFLRRAVFDTERSTPTYLPVLDEDDGKPWGFLPALLGSVSLVQHSAFSKRRRPSIWQVSDSLVLVPPVGEEEN